MSRIFHKHRPNIHHQSAPQLYLWLLGLSIKGSVAMKEAWKHQETLASHPEKNCY